MCCNSSEIACRALLGVFLLDILMSGLVLFCIATVISFIAIGWGTWGKNRSHNNALQFPTRLSSLSRIWPEKNRTTVHFSDRIFVQSSFTTLWKLIYVRKGSAAENSKRTSNISQSVQFYITRIICRIEPVVFYDKLQMAHVQQIHRNLKQTCYM